MSYTPNVWANGDVVTSEKLNAMEQGIAAAGALVVNADLETGALDKTWQEIHDAMPSVYVLVSDTYAPVYAVAQSGDFWFVAAWYIGANSQLQFVASSASGYPTVDMGGGGDDPPSV